MSYTTRFKQESQGRLRSEGDNRSLKEMYAGQWNICMAFPTEGSASEVSDMKA